MSKRPVKRVQVDAIPSQYFYDAETEFIPTGCTLLDCAISGGYAMGRVVNLVGDKSSGKTLLAVEACANFAEIYPSGLIFYGESEAAFDVKYAKSLGLPVEITTIADPEKFNTVEHFNTELNRFIDETLARKEEDPSACGLFVLDSLDALSDDTEIAADPSDKRTYGTSKAKFLSKMFRIELCSRLRSANVTLIIISQIRENLNAGLFGKKWVRSGGKALDFYASQVIQLADLGKIKKDINKTTRTVGVKVRAYCDKNKIGNPYRECGFPVVFNFGIDDVKASIDFLKDLDLLKPFFERYDCKAASSLLAKAEAMGDDEYHALRLELANIVIENWHEIETTFLPKRSKYGSRSNTA